jgi:hypothetical protein
MSIDAMKQGQKPKHQLKFESEDRKVLVRRLDHLRNKAHPNSFVAAETGALQRALDLIERFELWEASKLPEPEQAEKQGSYWEEEARRYAGNADFWREKAKRQPLTEEEIGLLTTGDGWSHCDTHALALFARAIERKHGIGV